MKLKPPKGVSERKFKFLMAKRYFDTGYGITGYVKYLIGIFGLSSLNVTATMILGAVYAVSCYVVGYLWYKYGFVEADTEIGNMYNFFVHDMRKKLTKK